MRDMPALGPAKQAFTTRQADRAAASGPGAGFGSNVSGDLALAEAIAPRRRRNVRPARRRARMADPAIIKPVGLSVGAVGIAA